MVESGGCYGGAELVADVEIRYWLAYGLTATMEPFVTSLLATSGEGA
jgi:hypothetical protein